MNVSVIYSTPTKRAKQNPYSASDADTGIVARYVAQALKTKNLSVELVPIGENGIEKIKHLTPDCIFNLIEWTGLDFPHALKAFTYLYETHIPFTGCSYFGYYLSHNKPFMKQMLKDSELPTAKWQVFETGNEPIQKFSYPVIVKPAFEHCSIALDKDSVIHTASKTRKIIKQRIHTFQQAFYVEEFLDGREFQVTVLEMGDNLVIFPIEEVVYANKSKLNFLTYDSKWTQNHTDYVLTHTKISDIKGALKNTIEELVTHAFHLLGMKGYVRFDLRLKNNKIYFLEVNSNPNLYDPEDTNQQCYEVIGMSFADYVWHIFKAAFKMPIFDSSDLITDLRQNIYCRIKKSKIHGIGVHAIKFITKGINPFKTLNPESNINPLNISLSEIEGDPLIDLGVKKMIKDFYSSKNGFIEFHNCGLNEINISYFMNHSKSPNIGYREQEGSFYALRDIKQGEELTVNYQRFSDTT